MKIGLGRVPCIRAGANAKGRISDGDLVAFSREQAGHSPTIFLAEEETAPRAELAALREHAVSVLTPRLRASFLEAKDLERRYQVLGSALAADLGPSALSPYSPGKPASGSRFFGRGKFIQQIISGKSVKNSTIVGNRRIGKTSLLHEIRERLSELYKPGHTIHFADVYASKCQSTWDAVYLILSQLGVALPTQWTKFGAIAPRFVKRFPQILHDFARQRQTLVVLFFDEFDSFLESDRQNDWQFAHLLREVAAEEGLCAVIIAGFRSLMQARVKQDTPYYNFTGEIALTPLTREETLDMVQIPLGRLGIDVSQSTIPSLIYRETRGKPEMIQMYCQAVISLYERRNALPHEAELQQFVSRDPSFNRTILHTFLNNTNPFEQVLSFQLMKKLLAGTEGSAHFEFRVKDAEEGLAAAGISLSNAEMATLLHNLVVGSIIERVSGVPGHFHFAVPQLVRYCKLVGVDELLANAMRLAQQEPPSLDALSVDPGSDEK
jgi:hypothetical protein